jgi:uncharacterized protein YdhG (YjbR/CyaY superfamily)
MKSKQKSTKSTTATKKRYEGFTAEEKAAMQDRVQEMKVEGRRGSRADKADGESEVLAKIAELPASDRDMAKRLHAVIKASAPSLSPKLWYGMPAYAKDGKNVCFFQSARKFKTRYATLGFNDAAHLDEGNMWPTAYALMKLTPADEARIGALVKKAVS